MNVELKRRLELSVEAGSAEAAEARIPEAARAVVVNRTHRIVRERAKTMQARRSLVRSLWLPLGICSGLLVVICLAIWNLLDQYELSPTGIPDASQQMLVLLMWCLPLSGAVIALVWLRRNGNKANGGTP